MTATALKLADRPPLGTPRPVDVHVGARLRQRRTLLGMSQEKLGESVGLTFQQIQKYERGANRIGASRLFQLSQVLDVSVSYFFEEMPGEVQKTRGDYAAPSNVIEIEAVQTGDPMARRETLELVRAYYKIDDPKVRKRIFELTKSIANASDDED
ncbi:MAG: helix-turn-helix transcriptional regulator [Alphaproteobacteria bacterium]|nr:helix-turn-helix transcriptional regulator [Alphaproteobacteria bacterium]